MDLFATFLLRLKPWKPVYIGDLLNRDFLTVAAWVPKVGTKLHLHKRQGCWSGELVMWEEHSDLAAVSVVYAESLVVGCGQVSSSVSSS